ncbi:hypothetical protein JCM8097_002665, partial [Rhodosporidiobolus ruineniae]
MLAISLSVLALLAAGSSASPLQADDKNFPNGSRPLTRRAIEKRAAVPSLATDPDWTYVGCYPWTTHDGDNAPFPEWDYTAFDNAHATLKDCFAYALSKNATAAYSGSDGWYCNVGSVPDSNWPQADPSHCIDPCVGNPSESCGDYMSGIVYKYAPKPKGPQFIQSYSSGSTKWTRSGCQSDLLYGTRALPNLLAQTANQTVEACLDACTSAGYTQCGVEYHGGGNALDKTSQALGDDSCNLLCADNALEYCGGNGGPSGAAFQLFTTPSKPVVTTTTTAAPVASPTPTFVKSYKTSGKKGKTFTRKGCQSDLLYGTRALPNLLAQTANQAVEACLEACATNKYSLCGVEYKGECWGANKLDSTSQALDDSACNLPCADNSLEYCGGTGGPSGSAFQLFS